MIITNVSGNFCGVPSLVVTGLIYTVMAAKPLRIANNFFLVNS
jgi:hypothetical protein